MASVLLWHQGDQVVASVVAAPSRDVLLFLPRSSLHWVVAPYNLKDHLFSVALSGASSSPSFPPTIAPSYPPPPLTLLPLSLPLPLLPPSSNLFHTLLPLPLPHPLSSPSTPIRARQSCICFAFSLSFPSQPAELAAIHDLRARLRVGKGSRGRDKTAGFLAALTVGEGRGPSHAVGAAQRCHYGALAIILVITISASSWQSARAFGYGDGTQPTDGTQLNSDGTQLNSDGTQLNSDGTQLNSDGTQPNSDGTGLNSDGTQLNSDGTQLTSDGTQLNPSGDQQQLNSGGDQQQLTYGGNQQQQQNSGGNQQQLNSAGAQTDNTVAPIANDNNGYTNSGYTDTPSVESVPTKTNDMKIVEKSAAIVVPFGANVGPVADVSAAGGLKVTGRNNEVEINPAGSASVSSDLLKTDVSGDAIGSAKFNREGVTVNADGSANANLFNGVGTGEAKAKGSAGVTKSGVNADASVGATADVAGVGANVNIGAAGGFSKKEVNAKAGFGIGGNVKNVGGAGTNIESAAKVSRDKINAEAGFGFGANVAGIGAGGTATSAAEISRQGVKAGANAGASVQLGDFARSANFVQVSWCSTVTADGKTEEVAKGCKKIVAQPQKGCQGNPLDKFEFNPQKAARKAMSKFFGMFRINKKEVARSLRCVNCKSSPPPPQFNSILAAP
ncbi:unnamed protein product [Closterium sp. Yama58-4]|nr:unnamed protein product [Closterium sp. Yama58-4]